MRLWRRLFDTHVSTDRLLRRHAFVAFVIFAVEAVSVGVHLLTGGHYPGLLHTPTDVVIDSVLTALWTVSALAMVLRWSPLVYIALIGCGASFTHGLLVSVSTPFSGIPFLAFGCIVTYAVFRALPLFRPVPPHAVGPDHALGRP